LADPLPEDSVIIFKLVKSHSGIKGEYLILETGFEHDRLIDALKTLVLRNLVYADLSNALRLDPHDFKECRFYPRV
jgi:hypothetical protein